MTKAANLPYLNGLRGMAVLTVFASHAMNVCYQGRYFGDGGGQLGVMLFFMLSGYLMSMLYLGRDPAGAACWQFTVNRFARIYVMFALVVIVNYGLSSIWPGVGTYGIKSGADLVEHLLFIKGYNVFWTVGPEVIFYGLFVMLWSMRARGPVAFWVALSALAVVSTVPCDLGRENSLACLHDRLPYFLVGMLLAARHDALASAAVRMSNVSKEAIFGAALVLFVAAMPGMSHKSIPIEMWASPFYLIVTAVMLVAAIACAPRLLTNRVAVFMGNISFSFYLLHNLILINVYDATSTHPFRVIALSFAAAIALSAACFYVIEQPTRKAIRSLGHSAPQLWAQIKTPSREF